MKIIIKNTYYNIKKEFETKEFMISYIENNLLNKSPELYNNRKVKKDDTIQDLINLYFPGYVRTK